MQIIDIAKKIEQAGGKLYLVGGALRDRFLNKQSLDEDYCVIGLDEEEFIKLFPNAHTRGKAFKVFDMEGHEFALARKEIKTGVGHKEFEIISNKKITIEEDLKRRDITINAIAEDVITKKIIDPFKRKRRYKKRRNKKNRRKFQRRSIKGLQSSKIFSNISI